MSTKLSKTFKEQKFKDSFFGEETRTIITVDYDPRDCSIEIVSIEVEKQKIHKLDSLISYSPMSSTIDVTDQFLDLFPSIQKEIEGMDWESEYRLKNVA